jgi:2-dehydropantoate 2-reductase
MAHPLHRRPPCRRLQGRVSWTFQSVAVVGSGAIGLYYGGRLAAAGENVKFLLRSDFEAVSRNGLKVQSVDGDFDLPNPQIYQNTAGIGPVDLVIVAWKATANHQLAAVIEPLLHADTQILTLQNGVGNCELLAGIVGPERVLGGLCFVCINRLSPGVISHSAGGRIALGEWRSNGTNRHLELEKRFKAAGIHGVAVENLEKSQWEKLVWNIPFNGLSVAAGGVTTDVLLATKESENEVRALMVEVIAAARALGFDLSDDLIHFNIERTRPMGPYRTSSMIDFVEGREVEVTPIWEEPLRRAQEAGVPMPLTAELLLRVQTRLSLRDSNLIETLP